MADKLTPIPGIGTADAVMRRLRDMGDGTFAETIATTPAPGKAGLANYPASSSPLSSASGNVANASAVATLSGSVGTTYISGFEVTGGGATAAALVSVTVAGLIGGTATYTIGVVAGATAPNAPLIVALQPTDPRECREYVHRRHGSCTWGRQYEFHGCCSRLQRVTIDPKYMGKHSPQRSRIH